MSDTAYEERIVRTMEAFRKNRYDVSRFAERTAAADYLAREIRGKRVGFGDSETLRALSLYERLSEHNESSILYNRKGIPHEQCVRMESLFHG